MRIVTARRISQTFFLLLLSWFAVSAGPGPRWWQTGGRVVDWLMQLDPLAAISILLATGTIYAGLLWALLTVVLTIVLGRFFCGWVCPFGAIHQFVGWLARRGKTRDARLAANRYRRWQVAKYYVLLVLLVAAAFGSLQVALFDPIPVVYRSFNLLLLPAADQVGQTIWPVGRLYQGAWAFGAVFVTAVVLNLAVPRFYCRFICPLGALLGILGRFSIWRIGKRTAGCSGCASCQLDCEGACSPAGRIRTSECVLCMNCLDDCPDGTIGYRTSLSAAGERGPDLSRRGVLASLLSGAVVVPLLRLGGKTGANWSSNVIRPPGALAEEQFLARCIKCGQCMRVCPTNVLQPAGLEGGLEGLWTPVLNNRIGTSGCQFNCVACGQVCPTAAIRPISLDERMGRGEFAEAGPIRIGTAFIDRGRCLPWAMNRPCIVCQENCPVSPKAIYTKEFFSAVRGGVVTVESVEGDVLRVRPTLPADRFATGDYYCRLLGARDARRYRIADNAGRTITLAGIAGEGPSPKPGDKLVVEIRLLRPYVDPDRCIGCGVCEHECPVSGRRAIRVTAENESRSRSKSLLAGSGNRLKRGG